MCSKDRYEEMLRDNRIYFGKNGDGVPRVKRFLSEVKGGSVSKTIWPRIDVGDNQESKREQKELMLFPVFATPKPERLIQRVLALATKPGDLVLDSFLGSGTTAAVAHKMGRRWIGVELGDHCYTHCKVRLDKVVNGEDQGGITKAVGWKGGGGYRFFELAPTLIKEDAYGQKIINPEYNAEKLAEAVCKLEGFTYAPSETEYFIHGYSTERDYIYVTTNYLKAEHLQALNELVGTDRTLLVCCKGFSSGVKLPNLKVKKIPKAVLDKCEYGHDDYSLNVKNLPMSAPELKQGEMSFD
jgi:adenine-specific DNA-methyltransferase